MAELLYATSHLAGDFTNPDNALGNTSSTWAGQLNTNTSQTSRWAVGDPVDPLTGAATQTIRVVARKGSNTGTPTIALNLYENGILVQSILAATNITAIAGIGVQTLTGTFDTSAVTDRNDVEIEVVMSAASGGPTARNSAQISHIEWTADTTAVADPLPELTTALGVVVDLSGGLDQPTASVPQLGSSLDVEVSLGGNLDQPTATVPAISSALDVVVDLGGGVAQPSPGVPGLVSSLDVTVDLAGTLDQPTASTPELTSSLDVIVDMGGMLADPGLVVVPSITTSLDIEVAMGGELNAPTSGVSEVSSSLDVVVDFGGTLDSPTPGVGELTTVLPVLIDLGGVLDVPGGVPLLVSSLDVEVGMGGTLAQPVATVPEVTSSLAVLVSLGGTVSHPMAPTVVPLEVAFGDMAAGWGVGRLELQ